MHSFGVHSNKSGCRKNGRLGLEQIYYLWFRLFCLVPLCVFHLKCKTVLSTHAHCKYSSASHIVKFRTLCKTAEVFELSHKNITFVTGCGHRNYVDCPPIWVRHMGDNYTQATNIWGCVIMGGMEISTPLDFT